MIPRVTQNEPQIPMSDSLNLYQVTVSQEWIAEGEAYVWAPDKTTAESWAKEEVELNPFDSEPEDSWSSARVLTVDENTMDIVGKDPFCSYIVPGSSGSYRNVGLEEFQNYYAEMFTPERLEAMRIARLEANNGQTSMW